MKRIITLILCIFAVSIMPLAAYAQKSEAEDRVLLARELVESLSEDYVFAEASEQTVTRAEFVFALMQALGQKGNSSGFDDVPEKHFAAKQIGAMKNMGLTGQSSMFYPDKPMTWQNAAEMAVAVLGYKEKAEYYGGYPKGYLRVANELRLDKGMDGKQMTVDNAVTVIYNIINSYPLEMASVKNGAIAYTPSDETLLYRYRRIAYAEGIVTADEASGLTNSKNAVDKGCIMINDAVYYGVTKSGLLGKSCAVFYTDTVKNTVVCIKEYKNDIQKMDIGQYNSVEDQSLVYEKEGGSFGNIRLDGSYTVLYNKKAAKSLDVDSYIKGAESGFVEVIDNDCDGRYDIISITDYKYAWVSGVDLINRVIFDRVSNESISLADDDIVLEVKTLSEGVVTRSELSELTGGSLIAYAASEDEKAYEIVICYDTKELTITAVSNDGDEIKTVADSSEYGMNSFIYNFTKNPIGVAGIFYLGVNGEIAALSGYGRDMVYGFVYRADVDREDSRPYLKVINEGNRLEMYKLAENVTVNGVGGKCDDIWDELKSDITSDDKMRVIRYKLKNNEIQAIDTPEELTAVESFSKADNSKDSLTVYYDGELAYTSSSAGFSPYFNIGASTVNFVIPAPGSDDEGDVSKYRVEYADYFLAGFNYEVVAYDIGASTAAGAILVYDKEDSRGVSEEAASAVVSKIEKTINEDDEPINILTLWENGVFNRYFTHTDCGGDIEKLEKGDMVRYRKAADDIVYIVIDYDLSENSYPSGKTAANRKIEFFGGKILSLSGGYSYVYKKTGDISMPVAFSDLRLTKISGVATALVEIDKDGRVEVKNMPDEAVRDYLSTGKSCDSIVARHRYYNPQMNVIYRMKGE